MNILKMFTVWICIECLHRISRSRLLQTQTSSVLSRGGGVSKIKNTCVKKKKV